MKTRTKIIGAAGAAMIIAVIGFAVWFMFLRGDGPAAATSVSAVAAVQEQQATDTPAQPDTAEAETAEEPAASVQEESALDGVWQLDTSFGEDEFPYDANSYVGYRVVEELVTIGAFTAVGRTTTVSGSLTIDGDQITAVDVLADLTRLKSDSSSRDEVIKSQALESTAFPEATFNLTEPIRLGDIPADGVTITVDAIGELTLHGVTNSVAVSLEATLVGGNTIVVVATIPVMFTDYEIQPPSAAIVASIEDEGEIELQLFFTN